MCVCVHDEPAWLCAEQHTSAVFASNAVLVPIHQTPAWFSTDMGENAEVKEGWKRDRIERKNFLSTTRTPKSYFFFHDARER